MNPPLNPSGQPDTLHPLVLVSGFLGAGKTTFIESLIPLLESRGVPVSVVLNDYENAAVDSMRLQPLASQFTALTGSCVCCDSEEDFLHALETIIVSPGGVLIVEANGTTDMTEMIGLLEMRGEARRFRSPLHVAQVDVRRWQKRGPAGNDIERWQLQTATHLCLNRAEELPAAQAEERLREIRWQAPSAREVTPATFAAQVITLAQAPRPVPASRLFRFPWTPAAGPLDPITGKPGRSDLFSSRLAPVRPPLAEHTHFTSFSAELPPLVHEADLRALLMSLPESVARVKGLVRLAADPYVLVNFQHVRPEADTLLIPMPGAQEVYHSLGGEGRIPLTAVVVGAWLDTEALEAAFSQLPAATAAPEFSW